MIFINHINDVALISYRVVPISCIIDISYVGIYNTKSMIITHVELSNWYAVFIHYVRLTNY